MTLIPENLGLMIYTSLGALFLYLFRQPALVNFLDKRFPKWKKGLAKEIIGLFLYVVFGGFIALIIASPNTIRQAFMSGMAWPALLEALERRESQ